jgi:hypothetical protein
MRRIPKLRNPGPWSFGIFAVSAALVAFLHWRGVPDAVKLAGQLVTLAVAAFGAKSALAAREGQVPPARPPLETWSGFDDDQRPKGGGQ